MKDCPRVHVGVGILIVNDLTDEVLFIKRSQNCRNARGKWQIPGGEVDHHELPIASAKREALEEVNAEIDLIHQFPPMLEIIDGQSWITLNFIAICNNKHAVKIMEPTKFDDMKWININNLPEGSSNGVKEVIHMYKNKNYGPVCIPMVITTSII